MTPEQEDASEQRRAVAARAVPKDIELFRKGIDHAIETFGFCKAFTGATIVFVTFLTNRHEWTAALCGLPILAGLVYLTSRQWATILRLRGHIDDLTVYVALDYDTKEVPDFSIAKFKEMAAKHQESQTPRN